MLNDDRRDETLPVRWNGRKRSVPAAVRRRERRRETKLVAITGYGQESDRERAHAAGLHAHLTKPVDFEQLRALLGMLEGGNADAGSS
jgi:CheY-like chemotaxis protein